MYLIFHVFFLYSSCIVHLLGEEVVRDRRHAVAVVGVAHARHRVQHEGVRRLRRVVRETPRAARVEDARVDAQPYCIMSAL